MSKQDYKVFWWIQIFPYGYDKDSELRNIQFSGVVSAESEDDAMEQIREDDEIIGFDFIDYPDGDYIDSHPDIEIVWTEDMSAEPVLDLTKDE
jgi:hypothetical protein